MNMPLMTRARLALCLTALGACLFPAGVRGDELQYLIDNPQMIMSLDVAAARKTRTWEELMKILKKEQKEPGAGIHDPFFKKVMESDLRVTWSFANRRGKPDGAMVVVFTAQKPLTIAGVWSWFAPIVKENPAELPKFAEVKHKGVTIYDLPSPMFIDGKYVVVAFPDRPRDMGDDENPGVKVLKKIIDRNKKPAAMSGAMQAALKEAPLTSTFRLALDLKSLPADAQADILSMFEGGPPAFADVKAHAGKVNGLAVTMEEKTKVKLTATLLCADKGTAAALKDIGVKAVPQIKTELTKLIKQAKEKKDEMAVKMLTAADTALNDLKISANGNNAVVAVALEPAEGGLALFLFALMPRAPQAAKSKVDLARLQCKVLRDAVLIYQIMNRGQMPASWDDLKKGTKDNPAILTKDASVIDPWGHPYKFELRGDEVVVFSDGPPGGPTITSKEGQAATPPRK